jgi:hypothetical protein
MKTFSRFAALALLASSLFPLPAAAAADAKASAATRDLGESLIDRMGGKEVLGSIVKGFFNKKGKYPELFAEPALQERLAKVADRKKFQDDVHAILCKVTGGSCKWEGKNFREYFAQFDIKSEDDLMVLSTRMRRAQQDMGIDREERSDLRKKLELPKSPEAK